MIKSLHIQNLQSHRDTVLDFVPGVNVITGVTDSGKSAIMRAFKILFQNKPTGEDFISHWGGDVVLKIITDEGQVERQKGKQNQYRLKIQDQPELVFKAFGMDVPVEVQKFLAIDSINFQSQSDDYFLLNRSAGEVAKHFNRVARLDKIDHCNAYFRSNIQRIESQVKTEKERLNRYQEQLQQFPDLQKIEADLEVLEEIETRKVQLGKLRGKLSGWLVRLDAVDERIEEEAVLLKHENRVNELLELIEKRGALKKKSRWLGGKLMELGTLDDDIRDYEKIQKLEPVVKDLLSKIENRVVLMTAKQRLVDGLYKLSTGDERLRKIQERVSKMETQFKLEMGDTCLLCGSKLKE